MILKKISVTNFLGIGERQTLTLGALTTLIGQNDAGKSSVLKALNAFFNESGKLNSDFRHVFGPENFASIELFFTPNREAIILDANVPTTFEDEELLNEDKEIQVKKTWDLSKDKPKPETFIMRKRYRNNDFLMATEKQMINLCSDLGIETKKGNGEEYNNVEKRSKLRGALANEEHDYVYEKLPTSGQTRAKSLGDSLKTVFPRFEYFKADTSLQETDTIIQSYFKLLVKNIIKEEFPDTDIERTIKDRIGKILQNISEKINQVVSADEHVSPHVEFNWGSLVSTHFRTKNERADIPLNQRGDGFRRITMMAYFEYLAEQDRQDDQNLIFGFEEPETFLHPLGQEKLFEKLKDVSQNGFQVIISSHSPSMVALSERKELVRVYRENSSTKFQQNDIDIKEIATDLGISMRNQLFDVFQRSKLLLFVEGADDVHAYEHVSDTYKATGIVEKSFDELGVTVIPIGGCGQVKHWVALDLIGKLQKPFFFLYDSDKERHDEESKNKLALVGHGLLPDVDFHVLRKREIENYFIPKAINRIVPEARLEFGDWDDVKKIVKLSPQSAVLGGKGIVGKHFSKMLFDELQESFTFEQNDEFLDIYNKIEKKLN